MFLFSRDHPARRAAQRIVAFPAFEYFIMACVLINSATLAVETTNKPGYAGSDLAQALNKLDYAIIAIFAAEMLLKWVAQGVILGKDAYIRDGEPAVRRRGRHQPPRWIGGCWCWCTNRREPARKPPPRPCPAPPAGWNIIDLVVVVLSVMMLWLLLIGLGALGKHCSLLLGEPYFGALI